MRVFLLLLLETTDNKVYKLLSSNIIMKQYDLEREFKKIQAAFERVRKDHEHVLKRLHVLEKENISLFNQLNTKKSTTTTKYIKQKEEKVYIGNNSSMMVHSQDCPYGKKITTERREIFDSVNDALKKKYKRCSCITS